MTAPSPVELATSIVGFTVTANGQALPPSVQVKAIDVWTGVNKLPKARLVISDGSAADQDFPISDSASLIPGATLQIALGYSGSETTVFTGVVYRQGLDVSVNGPSRLIVEATDKAKVMTLARRNQIFQNMTDSAVCAKLISDAGLSAAVTSTSLSYESIVQYYCTSWDLLLIRAQLNGMVVTVNNAKVTVAAPDTSASPVLTLTYGQSILDFRAEMDASTQFAASAIQSVAWDPSTQLPAKSGQAQANVSTPGNISSDTLAQVFNVSAYDQQTAGALQSSDLTQWSSAELLKSRLAKIRGETTFQGSALVTPGCMVTLAGLGDRFNGEAYVSGIHHRLSEGLWRTSVEIGLSPDWFAASAADIAAPDGAGQLPPANNLQIGTVTQIDQDPQGEYRVLVTLPVLQQSQGVGVWARFGSFYASKAIGSFFYPEIGDEVVVAFLSGDPRYPVILGSLYSAKNPPPSQPTAANNLKMFMTRSKLHMDFDEDQKAISLITPAGQSLKINDTEKSITLTDANGNSLTMSASGVVINSGTKDITISAGNSVTVTAKSAFSATGTGSAKLTSTGMVQVQGATVALNP
jgi:Rhs element Vgr protein